MLYNLTQVAADTTGPLGFVQGVDSVLMGGYLGAILLLVITIVAYASFEFANNDSGKSLFAASFIGLSFSIFFAAFGLISELILFTFVLVYAFFAAITWPS